MNSKNSKPIILALIILCAFYVYGIPPITSMILYIFATIGIIITIFILSAITVAGINEKTTIENKQLKNELSLLKNRLDVYLDNKIKKSTYEPLKTHFNERLKKYNKLKEDKYKTKTEQTEQTNVVVAID